MTKVTTQLNKTFLQLDNESILSSALKSGLNLQYSCKTGRCSTCISKLIKGKTEQFVEEIGLSEKEKSEGYILTCARYAIEDIELEINDLDEFAIPTPITMPCKIQSISSPSKDIKIISLRMPPNSKFNFIPGQYINLIGPRNIKRSYSIANNLQSNLIEIHIKKVTDGLFSDYWFHEAKVDDLLRFHGPLGTFFLRDKSNMGAIFLATGTGIAPIKSILDKLESSAEKIPQPIYLLWGVRDNADHYIDLSYNNLDLHYIRVLSNPENNFDGEIGYVQDVLMRLKLNLSKYFVYACGNQNMIQDSKNLLIDNGLHNLNFISDAFVDSGNPAEEGYN
jgi:CDP-4-dehydro-6-deoxyglucose reductase